MLSLFTGYKTKRWWELSDLEQEAVTKSYPPLSESERLGIKYQVKTVLEHRRGKDVDMKWTFRGENYRLSIVT